MCSPRLLFSSADEKHAAKKKAALAAINGDGHH